MFKQFSLICLALFIHLFFRPNEAQSRGDLAQQELENLQQESDDSKRASFVRIGRASFVRIGKRLQDELESMIEDEIERELEHQQEKRASFVRIGKKADAYSEDEKRSGKFVRIGRHPHSDDFEKRASFVRIGK